MKSSTKGALISALVVGLLPISASAQHFNIERLPNVNQPTDGFATQRLGSFPAGLGVSLITDYANDPLIVSLQRPPGAETAIVGDYFAAHVAISHGVGEHAVAFFGVDVPWVVNGDHSAALGNALPLPKGGGLGDLWLGGKVLLWQASTVPLSLAASGAVTLPTSSVSIAPNYRGEGTLTALPSVIAELVLGGVRFNTNLGVLLRATSETPSVNLGHDIRYAVSAAVPVTDEVEVLAEVFGASPLTDFADSEGVALEWLIGPKLHAPDGLTAGIAFGTGLTTGIGTPDYRVLLSLGYQAPVTQPEAVQVAPAPAPVEPPDLCPTQDEDFDGFQDDDGCPDLDNDADGIEDLVDGCPNAAEDLDGVDDGDGCPEEAEPIVDSDNDGLLAPADHCPNEAEDVDGFEDADGCPDIDNDGDTVLDVDDQCPVAPGLVAHNGCFRFVRIVPTGIQVLETIQFAVDIDAILDTSFPVMEELVQALNLLPGFKRLRVEGHTDARGDRWMNQRLSKRRARSVAQWLVEHGINPARLEPWGCGEMVPLESNISEAGRAKNRRVEFHVIDPLPADYLSPAGCQVSE